MELWCKLFPTSPSCYGMAMMAVAAATSEPLSKEAEQIEVCAELLAELETKLLEVKTPEEEEALYKEYRAKCEARLADCDLA